MSVPPRTERDRPGWEVSGEPPTPRAPNRKPDRLGPILVGIVLAALVVALVLVFVL